MINPSTTELPLSHARVQSTLATILFNTRHRTVADEWDMQEHIF
jgi:hypothetical protein